MYYLFHRTKIYIGGHILRESIKSNAYLLCDEQSKQFESSGH